MFINVMSIKEDKSIKKIAYNMTKVAIILITLYMSDHNYIHITLSMYKL